MWLNQTKPVSYYILLSRFGVLSLLKHTCTTKKDFKASMLQLVCNFKTRSTWGKIPVLTESSCLVAFLNMVGQIEFDA